VGGPLAGLKVLDLTAMLAGPYVTMIMADLGADIVKVESPGGDLTRLVGPYRAGDGPEGLAGYFQSVNRGKRSIVLDLKSPEGRAQLIELAKLADVLVENFSVGVMDRLGLGYEVLAKENPRLVYATIRGFGDPRTGESPYARWPAFDIVAQAMGGFLSLTGLPDGTPIKCGPGIGDVFPAVLLAIGILSAVHRVHVSGEGQFVDVGMYDAILSLCERMVYQYSYTGTAPRPQGNSHPMLCPFDIMPTRDGWLAIAGPTDPHWAIIADAIGRPDMIEDIRYKRNIDRVHNAQEVRAVLGEWLLAHTTDEVMTILGGKVPLGPVQDAAAIFADPHARARNMLVSLEQPGGQTPVVVAGQPIKFTGTPSEVSRRAPLLGEHDPAAVIAEWSAENDKVSVG
jgi:crotonobetainyl-CoA:carnitine CoA-transferase CaiB-like acyl-CoA transferase